MASSVTLLLRDHPELQPLILHDVTPTKNTIGAGSYGSVEEVVIPGALCAAKKLHHYLANEEKDWVSKEVVDKHVTKFVAECKLMARLRHPNIVQFLGLWFSQDEELCVPAIVMERMLMSLHNFLDPKSSTSPKQYIPLGLKSYILQDIARGIAYLHKQKPPVIHRDLTAANVLLNSAMVAKIADMGMARILPDKVNATMTKLPGAMVYMPPEAMEDKAKYDTSIDLFSLGVVAIFVLAQEFPCDLKAPNYTCPEKGLVARTELQRREKYTDKIHSGFPTPLIQLIKLCLKNNPAARPSIDNVLELLDQAMAESQDLQLSKEELLEEFEPKTELFQQLQRDERSQSVLVAMQRKCDAWREEAEKHKKELAQLHQEKAREVKEHSTEHTKVVEQEEDASPLNESQSSFESKSSDVKRSKRWKFWKKKKNANPGEKVEKLSSSTGENTQTNKSPSSSSKNYVLMAPDSSKNPVMAKSSSQGSTDEEKTTEGKGEMEGGVVETSVQDPDGQQDRVSAHSQGSGSQEQIEEEKTKPHENMETWFMEVERDHAIELLMDSVDGTFLCRPTSRHVQARLQSGEVHTHTIDVMCDGTQHHVRVFQHDGKYGLTSPCSFSSLMELVLHYSEHSLSTHNPELQTMLLFPLNNC